MKLVAKDDRCIAVMLYNNLIVIKEANSYNCGLIDILTVIANLIESHINHKIIIDDDFYFDLA